MAVVHWQARVLAPQEAVPTDPAVIIIPLDDYQPDKLRSDVLAELHRAGLQPPAAAWDLYRVAAAVFACDVRMPRSSAFDGWTRQITLSLPVADPARWETARPLLLHLLRYLSGDEWAVDFRSYPVSAPTTPSTTAPPLPAPVGPVSDAVCLLSGGLDSFIGAADQLAAGKHLTMVSHYGAGSAQHASPAQRDLKRLLHQAYPQQVREFAFNVDPRQGLTGLSEPTTRSRSLVFLTLGTLVAATQQVPLLYIPENGLITLNIPLTYSRLGSSSIRTTHPNTLHLFQQLVHSLGINVTVANPYRYQTKGEMLAGGQNQALLRAGLAHTMSCAHPSAARFQGQGVGHCGYCVPCIIRASAEHRAGLSGTAYVRTYAHDIRRKARANSRLTTQTGADLRAFEVAIARARLHPPGAAQVSQAGPLSSDAANLTHYVQVYTRGLREVEDFLSS